MAKRCHGLSLNERWSGLGSPPICKSPPHVGLPALEITHPFHFKLTPGVMLGPQCNHDLGVLLRMCELNPDGVKRDPNNPVDNAGRQAENVVGDSKRDAENLVDSAKRDPENLVGDSAQTSASSHHAKDLNGEQWMKTRAALVEAIGDHEFYCSSYSSKEQPHSDGLLLTLACSLRRKEEEIAQASAQGESVSAQEHARQLLHRLLLIGECTKAFQK